MSRIFSGVLQMSIAAAWMIPVVMVLRRLLKRAPKWVNLVLWGLVGLRLVCPFVPESRFSLMPKLPILSGYLYGNMIGSPAGNAFRADTLQNGTNFSDNISQAALDGSMGAAGSGMGGLSELPEVASEHLEQEYGEYRNGYYLHSRFSGWQV